MIETTELSSDCWEDCAPQQQVAAYIDIKSAALKIPLRDAVSQNIGRE